MLLKKIYETNLQWYTLYVFVTRTIIQIATIMKNHGSESCDQKTAHMTTTESLFTSNINKQKSENRSSQVLQNPSRFLLPGKDLSSS